MRRNSKGVEDTGIRVQGEPRSCTTTAAQRLPAGAGPLAERLLESLAER
jgi:hypothetical protein